MGRGPVRTFPAAAIVLLLALALALGGASAAVHSNPDFTAPATLTVLHGDVLVRHGDSAEVRALDGQVLQAGDVVRTEVDARAVITYFDGSHVALEPATELAIETLTGSSAADIVVLMHQSAGRTWHVVTHALSAASRYEVRTPAATAAVRGTAFEVAYDESREAGSSRPTEGRGVAASGRYDGVMRVTTTEGVVRTGNARGAVDVTPGRTTAAMTDAAPQVPVTAPAPARVVTVVVSAASATVVDPAGRPVVVKEGKVVRTVPGSTAERRADGTIVVTLPDIPSGTVTSHVKTSASAVDIKVQVREGGRVVSETTERREVRDGTAKGGVELAPDGRVTPLPDDEAREKPDPKISRPAAPPAAPQKEAVRPGEGAGPARASEASPSGFPSPSPARPSVENVAAKDEVRAKPAEVARVAPAAVKPEAPKLAPASSDDGNGADAKKKIETETASPAATQKRSAPSVPASGPRTTAGYTPPSVEVSTVAGTKTEAAPAKVGTGDDGKDAAKKKEDRGSGTTDAVKDGSGSGRGEAPRQGPPQAPAAAPAAVAASVAIEKRAERVESASTKVDDRSGPSSEAAVKDEQRAPSSEGARSPSEDAKKGEDAKKEEARKQDPPKDEGTRAETRAAHDPKPDEAKEKDEPKRNEAKQKDNDEKSGREKKPDEAKGVEPPSVSLPSLPAPGGNGGSRSSGSAKRGK